MKNEKNKTDYKKLIENAKSMTKRDGEHLYIVYIGGAKTFGWVDPVRPDALQELEQAGPNIRPIGYITFQNDELAHTTAYQISPFNAAQDEAELSRHLMAFLRERNAEIILEVKVRIPAR